MTRPIVFAPHSWGLSHVGRSLLVAAELRARGHRCVMVGDGPFVAPPGSITRRAGIEPFPLVDMTMDEVLVNGFDFHSAASLRRLVEAERAMIRELGPSLIVSDYRPSIHVAAAIEGVPVVALTNTHWTRWWGSRLSPPLEHPITLRAKGLLGERLGGALLERVAPIVAGRVFRRNVAIYNALLAEHGLPPHANILAFFEGSHATYLTDGPEWCATRADLPPEVRVAGPLYWSAEDPPGGWEAGLPTDLPWIYLSAGSSANPDVFPALFRELGGLPYRVLMTTAGVDLPDAVPANFTVADFLPGEAVMARAALSILNGGSGTIYQAIRARAPMVLVPMRGDQEWNGRDAERLGIARAIHRRHVIDRPGLLRGAVQAAIAGAPAQRAALDGLARKLERYRAAEAIADGVEALVGRPGAAEAS